MPGFSSTSRQVTSASARLDPQSTLIAATRHDGLGGRLFLAMANAKSLADMLDTVSDSTGRAIPGTSNFILSRRCARKECSADFIEKHWLGPKNQAAQFGVLENTAFTRSKQKRARKTRKSAGYE
ncbi:hypothetical protein BQ8794_30538 [Mesorhizobium prunaredense]|uniref:Uncharacterized protein n=1 Tax=Mesorhizobium prunaredense TaxID=1631249 RepID=A0A1R3VB37_9HYPH|nr:hypothetical protein [Mesorhizobium prunaredense]SIT57089.1 hypothetical protein BQ8794_30538 [Mesorhizobium prunaredense]